MNKKQRNEQPEVPMNLYGMFRGDPMGSYTGLPEPAFEEPVQDADDL